MISNMYPFTPVKLLRVDDRRKRRLSLERILALADVFMFGRARDVDIVHGKWRKRFAAYKELNDDIKQRQKSADPVRTGQ